MSERDGQSTLHARVLARLHGLVASEAESPRADDSDSSIGRDDRDLSVGVDDRDVDRVAGGTRTHSAGLGSETNPGPVAAPDGGSEGDVDVGSGPDDGDWDGDDPIVFAESSGADAAEATDDIVFEEGWPDEGDDAADGIAFEPDDRTDHDDEAAGDDPDDLAGQGPIDAEDAADGDALLAAVTGPGDAAEDSEESPDVPDEPTPEAPVDHSSDDPAEPSHDRAELVRRMDDLAAERDEMADRVAGLEDEVADLHSTLESLRGDLDRLVRLAAGAAAPTNDPEPPEGGSEADPVESPSDEGRSTDAALDAEDVRADDSERFLREDSSGADASVDDGVEAGEAELDDASGATGDSTAPARDPEPTAETGSNDSDPVASDGPRGPSNEVSARELVDPTSDAVGARLRRFQETFDADGADGLDAAGDAFQFSKVLLPGEDGAVPELAGDHLSKPYLEALPDGYAAEAAVIEWLDWLVSETDRETAARAIAYYASVSWVTPEVADALVTYLEGIESLDPPGDVDEPPSSMDLDQHLHSLRYVTALASGEVAADGV